jgi:proteasome accessory factor A
VIFKNNVDSAGNTFGCHENYLMQRDSFLLAGEPFLRYLIRVLVPFLVPRPIFCGTGSVLAGKPGRGATFSIYQRGPFIESLVSKETLKDRAILN